MIEEFDGYRHLENLGTVPSVYYLPAANRQEPFEKGLEGKDEELLKRYERTPYFKDKINE
jgi:molybdopterin-containing oxidoreductase family iron-sulfur binding subunit